MTMRHLPLLFASVLALASAGCKKKQTIAPQGTALAPLSSAATQAMPLAGLGASVVAVPEGIRAPAPVLVAVLGIGDTPEEQCDVWRELVGAHAFVICPRGAVHWVRDGADGGSEDAPPPGEPEPPAGGDEDDTAPSEKPVAPAKPAETGKLRAAGFYPVDLAKLDGEVTLALKALKQRFGAYVDDREPVYAGFSRGAFLGASLVAKHPERFRRAVLIEGGQSPWSPESASAFAKGGGQRVLFVCGQQSCVDESESAAVHLRGQNVETKIVMGAEGHGYKKQVKDQLRHSLGWITEGDPRWQ